ncbi:hypothetical protein NSU_2258 [Novosphingobium pentaromativorans US6-1]|uniref:Uncharacterized protein n=1 Tax=Novosphingobium pentaromativorans US6-1 TaxID=1088721 RepID=G6ED37_9SPHN|nr:hypothetical protein NSU_2258 [Novosphingobium pentaromativorans US6-1]
MPRLIPTRDTMPGSSASSTGSCKIWRDCRARLPDAIRS